VVTGSDDGTLRLWDGVTGAEKLYLESPTGLTGMAVDVSPDGAFVVANGGYNTVRIWGAASGTEWQNFTANGTYVLPLRNPVPRRRFVASVAVSSDATSVVTAIGCCAWTWDAPTPGPTPSPTPSPTPEPTLHPPKCEGWCENHHDEWTTKCTWRDCGTCTECAKDSWMMTTFLALLGTTVALFIVLMVGLVFARGGIFMRTTPNRNEALPVPPTVHGSAAAS